MSDQFEPIYRLPLLDKQGLPTRPGCGHAELDNGEKTKPRGFPGFAERVDNIW